MQKTKKNCNFGLFAECNGHGTRQSWETLPSVRTLHSAKIFYKKNKKSLPSAKLGRHSAKSFLKKLKMALPSARRRGARQRVFKKNKKCLCRVPCRRGTRQRVFEKKMSLPSALTIGTRQRRRQRSSAVDGCFSLPSVVVGPWKRIYRVPDK